MSDFNSIFFQAERPLLKEITANRLNTILAEIRRNKPKGERGITVRQSGDGTYIGLATGLGRGGATTAEPKPFQLEVVDVSEPEDETPDWRVRVYASTLAGGSSTDLGFALADDPPYLLEAQEGFLQGGITIDEEGNVTSRWLEIVAELSADTATQFHVEIGTVQELEEGFSVSNSRYGPIDVQICRDWFSNPPTYSVSFFDTVV